MNALPIIVDQNITYQRALGIICLMLSQDKKYNYVFKIGELYQCLTECVEKGWYLIEVDNEKRPIRCSCWLDEVSFNHEFKYEFTFIDVNIKMDLL